MTSPQSSSPSALVDYCEACDRAAAVPLSTEERVRFEALRAVAKTIGLVGKERGEYMRFSQRRNS